MPISIKPNKLHHLDILLWLFAMVCLVSTQSLSQTTRYSDARFHDFIAPKPYRQLITNEAQTDSGLFTVHYVQGKRYIEIPLSELGKDFLFVARLSHTQSGVGQLGDILQEQMIRWDLFGGKIYLKSVLYNLAAPDSETVVTTVKNATAPIILASFDIQAVNTESTAVVIDIGDLFISDIPELAMQKKLRDQFGIRNIDTDRSYTESIKSYSTNLEVQAFLTYSATNIPETAALHTARSVTVASVTLGIHYSMVRLPDQPMRRRPADRRLGYMVQSVDKYPATFEPVESERHILRWRLEPKNPDVIRRGELSDPVQPITYYVDRSIPTTWRQWVTKGVLNWNSAFRQAGFKNAIQVIDAPSPEEDPKWSADDARYSVIRWVPSDIEDAYGIPLSDPRTGEILTASIGIYHNLLKNSALQYAIQAGASIPRFRKLPLPDSLVGEMLAATVTHEVGHTLGLKHNMKSSSSYPVDSLRSKTFTERFGIEASIMDYARNNYIAQPGDDVRQIPILGPYDYFAIEWGYKPIPGVGTAEEERDILNTIAARQELDPMLRFGDSDGIDPTAQTEDLGDDPIKASTYGLQNIARIADALPEIATLDRNDYTLLQEFYTELERQRTRELLHVVALIGGVV
ncbi:MAG TPA: zinc-dependent metalloprotease, partial [Bacteroidota bacterium]